MNPYADAYTKTFTRNFSLKFFKHYNFACSQYFIPIIILYTHNNIFISIHSNKDYRIKFKYT